MSRNLPEEFQTSAYMTERLTNRQDGPPSERNMSAGLLVMLVQLGFIEMDAEQFGALLKMIFSGDFSIENIHAIIGVPEGENVYEYVSREYNIDNPEGLARSAFRPSPIGNISVGERQEAVLSHLEKAEAATGVSREILQATWGIETAYGTHDTMRSTTGCLGDFQFCHSTFDTILDRYGDQIIAAAGDDLEPEAIRAIQNGNWENASTEWGNDLRFHPVVSTYAAAFLHQENAKGLNVDPMNFDNFGIMMGAYNIGPSNIRIVKNDLLHTANAGDALDSRVSGTPAGWNPIFFKNGVNGAGVLANYQSVGQQRLDDFNRIFADQLPNAQVAQEETKEPVSATLDKAAEEFRGEFQKLTNIEIPKTPGSPGSEIKPTDPVA